MSRQSEIDKIAKILCGNKHIGCQNSIKNVAKPCDWCRESAVILVDNDIGTKGRFEIKLIDDGMGYPGVEVIKPINYKEKQ